MKEGAESKNGSKNKIKAQLLLIADDKRVEMATARARKENHYDYEISRFRLCRAVGHHSKLEMKKRWQKECDEKRAERIIETHMEST